MFLTVFSINVYNYQLETYFVKQLCKKISKLLSRSTLKIIANPDRANNCLTIIYKKTFFIKILSCDICTKQLIKNENKIVLMIYIRKPALMIKIYDEHE